VCGAVGVGLPICETNVYASLGNCWSCILSNTIIESFIGEVITRPTERGVSRGGAPGPMSLGGTNKQVESCFLNHNSSIHFCCTDALFMTHRGGLSLSIIIWRMRGGEPSFLLLWGPNILLAALIITYDPKMLCTISLSRWSEILVTKMLKLTEKQLKRYMIYKTQ